MNNIEKDIFKVMEEVNIDGRLQLDKNVKEYLIDVPKENILVIGINPNKSKEEIKNKLNRRPLCLDIDSTLEIINENLKKQLISLLDEKDIYQKYYYPNYKLFKDMGGRLFWSYYSKEEFWGNLSKIFTEIDNKEELIDILEYIINTEMKKNGPCIVFGDLFWYVDGNQKNIEAAIKKFLNEGQQNE